MTGRLPVAPGFLPLPQRALIRRRFNHLPDDEQPDGILVSIEQ